jgi:hypothetical protein
VIPKGFHRVSKRERCPVCQSPDWCLVSNDGTRAICPRTESAQRFGKDAGWLHVLDGTRTAPRRRHWTDVKLDKRKTIDFAGLHSKWSNETTVDQLAGFADSLGVSRESLAWLGCSWAASFNAWAFPMKAADESIVGVRLRNTEGKKWSVTGSRSALFIPHGFDDAAQLVICEGPTDCAALLDLGFYAIGRPDCQSGRAAAAEFLRRRRVRDVVIFADADGPGLRGAQTLADELWMPTRIVAPPRCKDVREWKGKGATRAAVDLVIRAATYEQRKRSA